MKITQKAIKLSLFLLTALAACTSVTSIESKDFKNPATLIDEQQAALQNAIKVFGPFFTDPHLSEVRPFKEMCCEVIPHLERTGDADLVKLAATLKKVCAQPKITPESLAVALIKFIGSIQKHFGNLLPLNVLKIRLQHSLNK